MYLWHIVSNVIACISRPQSVVNCFQNVSLTYRFQSNSSTKITTPCCELLSKCIFDISFPINGYYNDVAKMLWIAFKMYLWHIVSNMVCFDRWFTFVVNCFQNVSLTYRFQSKNILPTNPASCELLSKCIFDISFPICNTSSKVFALLWIAFKMYLWHIVSNRPYDKSLKINQLQRKSGNEKTTKSGKDVPIFTAFFVPIGPLSILSFELRVLGFECVFQLKTLNSKLKTVPIAADLMGCWPA